MPNQVFVHGNTEFTIAQEKGKFNKCMEKWQGRGIQPCVAEDFVKIMRTKGEIRVI